MLPSRPVLRQCLLLPYVPLPVTGSASVPAVNWQLIGFQVPEESPSRIFSLHFETRSFTGKELPYASFFGYDPVHDCFYFRRSDNRLMQRQPVNTDIQKTADNYADDKI